MGFLAASSAMAFSAAYFCESLNAATVRIPSEGQVTNTHSIHIISLRSHTALPFRSRASFEPNFKRTCLCQETVLYVNSLVSVVTKQ